MKVLVTGASGFLGSLICRRLLSDGEQVRGFCRPTSDLSRLQGLDMECVRGDVTEPESVRQAVRGCKWVIHAAANLAYWRGDEEWQTRVNVEGTRHVAEAARLGGVRRLVHISSVAAVGIPENPAHPANEEFVFNLEKSRLNYHISKRRAEEVVCAEVKRGLDAVTVNPASIQSAQRTQQLLRKARTNRVLTYFSGGNCVVLVEDVVAGILAALVRGEKGHRYILGGENMTFFAMQERTAAALGLRRRYLRVAPCVTGLAAALLEPWARLRGTKPRITHMVHYCANRFQYYNSGKARQALGYSPRDFTAILKAAMHAPAEPDSVTL